MKMTAVTSIVIFASMMSMGAASNATEDALYNLTYGDRAGHKMAPMQKVMDMLNDLRMKVVNEEKEAYIIYSQYTALCDKKWHAQSWLISEDEDEMTELRAQIQAELAEIKSMVAEISELTTRLAKDSATYNAMVIQRKIDLEIHEKEMTELEASIDMLKRAIAVLSTEKGTALMQTQNANNVAKALETMVKASQISFADAAGITALIQAREEAKDDDKELDASKLDEVGAPSEIYESKTGTIIDTLAETLDTAEKELDEAMKAEAKAKGEYELDEQALKNKIQNDKDRLEEIRGDKSAEEADEANKEGEFIEVKDLLTIAERTRNMTDDECKLARDEFLEESKAREEEVKVVTKAMNALGDATGVKTTHQFNYTVKLDDEPKEDAFLQLQTQVNAKLDSALMNKLYQAVKVVQKLGHEDKSDALTKLAMRMTNAVRAGSKDPFKKVKGLIKEMIYQLEKKNRDEEEEHEWCTTNMAFAEKNYMEKKQALMIAQGKLDYALAELAKLDRQLSEIGKSGVLDAKTEETEGRLRAKEQALYEKTRAANLKAIDGIEMAVNILRKYYEADENTRSTDVVHTVVELLHIVSEDLEKNIALMDADNKLAQEIFEKSKAENQVAATAYVKDKEQLGIKREELEKRIVILTQARDAAQAEADVAWEFYAQVKERCTTKADQHAERIAKAEKELAGLREALDILREETVDTPSIEDTRYALNTRSLRGLRRH